MRRAIALCFAGFVLMSRADTVTFTTITNLAIPDDTYNGSIASMAACPVPVTLTNIVQQVAVTVAINHTFVGDLVIKLVSPNNTVVTLVSRPGFSETADDGTSGFGNSANLASTSPITFQQGAATSAESLGTGLADSGVVCQDNAICTYNPNNGAAAAGNLTSFNGQSPTGNWKLCVGDSGSGDTGTIIRASLTFVVPDQPPPLRIVRSGTNVVLTWPTNSINFSLEANPVAQTNGWAFVTNSSAPRVGTNFSFALPATNSSRFFRLRE